MENLIIAIIILTALGFGLVILFITKLLKEQKLTNDNFDSNLKVLSEIKSQLDKLEIAEKEHKSVSQTGFAQIENALKETIKLD